MAMWLVYLIFLISGISGLIYEVVWTRQFGNLFGNTIYSASIVTSVFMGGLGFGGFYAGRWCDKLQNLGRSKQLKAYGLLEISIAVLALILAFVVPHLEALSSSISSYVPVQVGIASNAFQLSTASHLFRFLLAAILICPVTLLMGATLPILIRVVVNSRMERVGWHVGLLYGINTLGAAVGAFAVDFAFVPNVGISRTQFVAALFNLIAGISALLLARQKGRTEADTSVTKPELGHAVAPKTLYAVGVGILLAGFVAMGLQIAWFRFLMGILESTRSVFSLLLTVILVGLFIGTLIGGRIRWRPLGSFIVAQAALPIAAIALFYFYDASILDVRNLRELFKANAANSMGSWIERWFLLRPILFLVGIPAIIAGLSYPLANAYIQRTSRSIGTNAGTLYLFNTVGAIFGSLLTGFIFLPTFGVQQTLTTLAALSLLGIASLYVSSEDKRTLGKSGLIAAVVSALALVLTMGAWLDLEWDYLLKKVYRQDNALGGHYITRAEGLTEYVAVVEKPPSKNPNETPDRSLLTNGIMMSWTDSVAQRYMRGFTHIPLLQLENPERVLVICYGVGNTVNSASLHPSVKQVDVADLSKEVLELAPEFAHWSGNVLADPRTHVHVNDGRQHLRMVPEGTYDLVTLEPPPMGNAGVASLYSLEFYQLAKSRLKAGGYVTQWLPLGQAPAEETKAMVRAFTAVFPNMVMLAASKAHLIMLGKNSETNLLDYKKLRANIESRPTVKTDLDRINLLTPTEFVGMFVNIGANLDRDFADAEPLHDDRPVMEYWRIAFREISVPSDMHRPKELVKWCPTCFSDGKPISELKNVEPYMHLLHRSIFGRQPGEKPVGEILKDSSAEGEALRASPYLKKIWELE